MREIKFRAWDKNSEYMHPNVESGVIEDPDEWIEFDTVLGLERFEVMQYTGLKDKNGREIFEGDLCERDGTVYEVRWVENLAKYGMFVAKTESVLARGMTFPLQQYVIDGTLECTVEIIGNIYEHPHLMETSP